MKREGEEERCLGTGRRSRRSRLPEQCGGSLNG